MGMETTDFRDLMVGIRDWPPSIFERVNTPTYNDHTILHAITGNAACPDNFKNCRYIKADAAGIVRIRYKDDFGGEHIEVLSLLASVPHPVRNVDMLFQYYVGTTQGTASVYKSDGGTLVNAIKLLR